MALLVCDGLDNYADMSHAVLNGWSEFSASDWSIDATGGVTGGPCLKCIQDDSRITRRIRSNTAGLNYIRGMFWFKSSGSPGLGDNLFHLTDSSKPNSFLNWLITSTGELLCRKVYISLTSSNTTLAVTSGANLHDGAWHCIQFYWKNGAAGAAKCIIDGIVMFDLSGVETGEGTSTAYDLDNVDVLYLSAPDTDGWWDDLILWDDEAGDGFTGEISGTRLIHTLRPNGAGVNAGFTPTAGSNYQNVDDATPDSITTFNYTSIPGTVDDFAYGDLPITPSEITMAVANTICRAAPGSTATIRNKALSNGSTINGANQSISSVGWRNIQTPFLLDPDGSVAWTKAKLDAATFGYELVS